MNIMALGAVKFVVLTATSKYSENNFSLEKIAEIMGGFDSNTYSNFVTQTFKNNAIYNQALSIYDICKPIAATILSLMFILELYNVTIRTDNEGGKAFEIPFKTMFKMVVCMTVFNHTPDILEALFQIPQSVVSGLSVSNVPLESGDLNTIAEVLDGYKMGQRFLTAIQVFLIWAVYKFAGMAVNLVLLGRIIEIYLLFALSPLPMATIANKDLNSIAKKFLKSFAAVSVQGAVLFIILSFYPALISQATDNISSSSDILGSLWTVMFYSLVLVVCIFSSSKYSKMITDAA